MAMGTHETAKALYIRPELTIWGKVEDLTLTGGSTPGGDGKEGSVASMGQ